MLQLIYQVLIYTLMGHQISTSQRLTANKKQSILFQYHTKLFLKNKMSSSRFKEELDSVCKRSAYLHYEWVKELLVELKYSNTKKLYTDYQTVLKENCMREGKKEKIFCPSKIKNRFISKFTEKLNQKQVVASGQLLDASFQQCKCYFMVMSWLHKMVTLSTNDQQNRAGYDAEDWDLSEQQKIFDTLLNFSTKIYHQIRSFAGYATEINGIPEHMNSNLRSLIKKIVSKNLKFVEKEVLIGKIQQQLASDVENLNQNVAILKKIIGVDRIYAYLRTIRQVGHIDVSLLWSYFGEDLY